MGEVVSFRRRSADAKKSAGGTLCREGHHKWRVDKARQFDVKQGKLVTVYKCERCGKQRVKAH